MLGDKLYAIIKWAVLIALPAAVTLWLGLGQIWDFPLYTEIAATVTLITAFLGALIGLSNKQYKDQNKDV